MKGLVVGALVALMATAHADSAADLRAAQQLFTEAERADDVDRYRACAKAFVAVHAALPPKSPDAAAALFSAAVCHERGHEAKAALALYDQLAKLPPSEHAVQARFRAAQLVAAMGKHDDAARRFEAHAAAHAKSPPTMTKDLTAEMALYNAAQLWLVHGDDARAIALADRHGKLYPRSVHAPKLAWLVAPAHERRGAASYVAYLQRTLRQFGTGLGPLQLAVNLELGEALWKRSCPVPGHDGLCVKVERAGHGAAPPAGPQLHCRGARRLRITPVARDARLARAAQAELHRVSLVGQGPDSRRAVARAQLLLADARLEAYLGKPFPTRLDFDPKRPAVAKASMQKFQDWLAAKTKLGTEVRDRYTAAAAVASPLPETDIAAMARIGQMLEAMAIDLATAEIPRDIRSGAFAADKIGAFCDKLVETSEPLVAQAKSAFESCLTKAGQSATHDRSSQICERELAHLDPKAPIATVEMVPLPPVPVPLALEGEPRPSKPPAELVAALAAYQTAATHGVWTAAACKDTAAKFASIATKHRSADARYMEGRVYQHCSLHADAERAYQLVLTDARASTALQSAARVNLGVARHRLGKPDAEAAWLAAKLPSADANLAGLQAARLRERPLDKIARDKLRAYLDGAVDPSAQLVRATHALATAVRTTKLAPIEDALSHARPERVEAQLAWAALEARRGAWPLVDRATAKALAMAPELDDVQAARGLALVRVRRWSEAADHLAKVKLPSYEVLVGRALALRGQGKTAEAEATYGKAIAMADARVEAHYNLGVLHADHVAARTQNPAVVREALQKAATAFRKAATLAPASDAKRRAEECDKQLAAMKP